MTVLITGANGFLGQRLTEVLLEKGYHVRGLVRVRPDDGILVHPAVEVAIGDVTDLESLKKAMKGVDQVYHLAGIANDWAPDMRMFYKVNAMGTENVYAAALENNVKRVVFTSSAGTIGPPDPDNVYPVNENHIRTVDYFLDYETSKAIAEERTQAWIKKGLDVVMVNPTRIYGRAPIDRKNSYLIVVRNYTRSFLCFVPGVRDVIGNYVYLDDVVEGHILAMQHGKSGEKYLLGGSNVSFGDLFKTLQALTGKKGRVVRVPFGLLSIAAAVDGLRSKLFRVAPVLTRKWIRKASMDWPVSSEKARHELGYSPKSFEDAMQTILDWMDAGQPAVEVNLPQTQPKSAESEPTHPINA